MICSIEYSPGLQWHVQLTSDDGNGILLVEVCFHTLLFSFVNTLQKVRGRRHLFLRKSMSFI
jgi:hypothetical protein